MVLGMPFSHFLYRITSEPFVVLKTVFLYWWIKLLGRRFDLYNCLEKDDLTKNDVYIPAIEYQLEKPQRLLKPKDQESIFFYGGNTSGDVLVARVSRQRECNIPWLHLGLSDGRTYDLPCPEKSYPPAGEFVAGGLRVKCILPMRKWRLSFNGLLREHSQGQKSSALVHVKFSFLCIPSSYPFDLTSDLHPTFIANYLARADKSSFNWNPKSVLKYLDSYVQTVMFLGTASVDSSDELQLCLWGARKRNRDSAIAGSDVGVKEFIGYSRDGQLIYSGEYRLPLSNETLPFAFYLERTSLSWPVISCSNVYKRKSDGFNGMDIQIQTERSMVTAIVEPPKDSVLFRDPDVSTKCHMTKFRLNDGDFGHGIFLDSQWNCRQSDVFEKPSWTVAQQGSRNKCGYVLPLSDAECQDSSVSGGKGSSLSTLTQLTKNYTTVFTVPTGFVVTTEAYCQFYSQAGAQNMVNQLQKEAWSYEPDKIKDICARLSDEVSRAKLPESVRKGIERQVNYLYSSKISGKRFAVRSSASGEDSEEMSAAGQMSTFLGIEGLENIYRSVVKCWSSQFSFTAVQYKRQNGQELNSPMAVVVQEMVPADTAGVLFTCDPVTGNPQNVTITANYGLGESVVSASADPDTIVFQRDEKNRLNLKSVQKGKKSTMIVMADEGETIEKEVENDAAESCCLAEDNASLLAQTGLKIESAYGFPLDIEWAFKDNRLYMLQARPVTTVDVETRFEVANCITTPLRAENEYTTKANVGEVMPGFASQLGLSLMRVQNCHAIQECYGHRNKYAFPYNPYRNMFDVWNNQTFFSIPNMILRFYQKGSQSFLSSANVVAAFGRELDDEEMLEQADRRNRMYPTTFVPLQVIYFIGDMIFGGKRLRKSIEELFHIEPDYNNCTTSKEMYDQIWRSCFQRTRSLGDHVTVSMNSSICNNIIMGLLAEGNKGWGVKVFSDFSKIMASCGHLESADIPRSITALSREILKSIEQERFKNMTTQEILKWLESTDSPAGTAYREFIKRHGHRCISEFDIYRKPWRIDPLPIIKMLQDSVASTKENEKASLSTAQLIDSLSVPLSLKSRLLLRLLIPLSHWAVFNREKAKSMAVKMTDFSRKGFWTLAKQMVKEGRLPEQELLFFLDHLEVVELIETRSPAIIQRAIRRKHMWQELDSYKYSEICKGVPVPLNSKRNIEEDTFASDLELKGTPVSQGVVKAFARVATSLEEAAKIIPGEILIAYSTDIAWSPYFPLLSGVATELGGLISHGAVVAREYGLPCVVGVHDATVKFRTGDYVLLNGNTGVLKRQQPPDNPPSS